jgi:hypothetical protein
MRSMSLNRKSVVHEACEPNKALHRVATTSGHHYYPESRYIMPQ